MACRGFYCAVHVLSTGCPSEVHRPVDNARSYPFSEVPGVITTTYINELRDAVIAEAAARKVDVNWTTPASTSTKIDYGTGGQHILELLDSVLDSLGMIGGYNYSGIVQREHYDDIKNRVNALYRDCLCNGNCGLYNVCNCYGNCGCNY